MCSHQPPFEVEPLEIGCFILVEVHLVQIESFVVSVSYELKSVPTMRKLSRTFSRTLTNSWRSRSRTQTSTTAESAQTIDERATLTTVFEGEDPLVE